MATVKVTEAGNRTCGQQRLPIRFSVARHVNMPWRVHFLSGNPIAVLTSVLYDGEILGRMITDRISRHYVLFPTFYMILWLL